MPFSQGKTICRGTISYCPQHAWIVQDSIRNNILLGQELDGGRYRRVLSVCGLEMDISTMPAADLTLIGDRGFTLSGGQKARISLASGAKKLHYLVSLKLPRDVSYQTYRAVYKEADIYLLDDPMSALDAKVGAHVFTHCIKEFLAGKTRLLVTHQLQYLPSVDHVVVVQEGTVTCRGSDDRISDLDAVAACQPQISKSSREFDQQQDLQQAKERDKNAAGTVGWSTYIKYFQAGGSLLFLACMLQGVITEAFSKAASWYLSAWSGAVNSVQSNTTTADSEADELMFTYIGLSAASTVLAFLQEGSVLLYCDLAAQRLHDSMFHRVMKAPVSFFDVTPVGIVLNRFSRDLGFVDLQFPYDFRSLVKNVLVSVSQVILVCIIFPWMFLAVALLTCLLWAVYVWCAPAIRDLKRMEAAARSPLYSHVSNTLSGLHSIRIMQQQKSFQQMFNKHLDDQTMRWLMFKTAFQCMGLIFFIVLLSFLSLVIIMAFLFKDDISGALLGLALSYVLSTLGPFEYTFRLAALVSNHMTSVERILLYSQLEQEAEDVTDFRPPDCWPAAGSVAFRSVSVYYHSSSQQALADISFDIFPNEKIGIVGRTGSGKSSLFQSMFRLTEPIGEIYIDGINIKEIGLHDLRNKLSVIPQDPVLFLETVKWNLDPFGKATDEELWSVLEKVQLAKKISKMPGGLEADIREGGSNLSVGERQLVCLARALLRSKKILLLDEATANIDQSTDRLIQLTIRKHFSDCMVLIIAHRLNTVMDCDRVMVLDQGRLAEFDSPHLLLKNKDGLLYKHVQQTGTANAALLTEMAEEARVNKGLKQDPVSSDV